AFDYDAPGNGNTAAATFATGTPLGGSDVDKDFHIINDGEIQFKGKGTLDNGIGIEVRVELESFSTGDQIDEVFVKVKSSLGTILIGANDTALDAVAGSIGRTGGGIAGGAWDRDFTTVPGATGHHLGDEGDDVAIHYYSPNISGFEFGVSWAPSTSSDDGDVDTKRDVTNSNDAISIGAAYAGSFGDVDFSIGGGYYTESDDDGDDEVQSYGGGVEFGIDGFIIGGAIVLRDREVGLREEELIQYGAGVEYETGPWVFGVSALYQELEDGDAVNQSVEGLVINAAVGYELGDGVDLGFGVDYGQIELDGAPDYDAFGGQLLLGVKF
ncbi:MAG: porin, partial [Pseudomonadota bacterium]